MLLIDLLYVESNNTMMSLYQINTAMYRIRALCLSWETFIDQGILSKALTEQAVQDEDISAGALWW